MLRASPRRLLCASSRERPAASHRQPVCLARCFNPPRPVVTEPGPVSSAFFFADCHINPRPSSSTSRPRPLFRSRKSWRRSVLILYFVARSAHPFSSSGLPLWDSVSASTRARRDEAGAPAPYVALPASSPRRRGTTSGEHRLNRSSVSTPSHLLLRVDATLWCPPSTRALLVVDRLARRARGPRAARIARPSVTRLPAQDGASPPLRQRAYTPRLDHRRYGLRCLGARPPLYHEPEAPAGARVTGGGVALIDARFSLVRARVPPRLLGRPSCASTTRASSALRRVEALASDVRAYSITVASSRRTARVCSATTSCNRTVARVIARSGSPRGRNLLSRAFLCARRGGLQLGSAG